MALNNVASILRTRGRAEEALALRRVLLARDREGDTLNSRLGTLLNLACDAISCGLHDESRAALDEARALAGRLGNPMRLAGGFAMTAIHHGLWGSEADARTAVEDADALLEGLASPAVSALTDVARAFVDLAAAREGDPSASRRLQARLDAPSADARRFQMVRWAQSLLEREARPGAPVLPEPSPGGHG